MREKAQSGQPPAVTRQMLIDGLNRDLSGEYQAIIAYVVYSSIIRGAQYMKIAAELELHAGEELQHALTVAQLIDYLGGTPSVVAEEVRMSSDPKALLRFDLQNETETIHRYRERVRQCEALEEYAAAEQLRTILVQEQEHQIDLATALGIDVPNMSKPAPRGAKATRTQRRPSAAKAAKSAAGKRRR